MNRYLTLLCSILLIKALCIVLVILYAGIGLGPDEAQYWTWSQALDWGYYSKPPGIAWQIWMGTHLFGNNELGVRFMSVVIGTLIPLSIYLMGIKAGLKQQVAFWAALLLALSPLGLLATFLAITDGGMFLFWTLACVIIVDALHREVTPNYLLFGFMVLLGALFKWPIYLLWVMVLISMLFWPVLRSHTIVFGGLVSLLGLFPSVIWNSQHEWSTFRHVFSTVKGGEKKALFSGNFFEFFGLQMGLLSPLLFILLLISFYYLINHRKTTTKALKFCGYTSLGLLLSAWSLSLVNKIQGNWVDYAYPTGAVLMAWALIEKLSLQQWLKGGVMLSLILCLFAVMLPEIQKRALLPIPYKFSLFRHNLGWDQLTDELLEVGYRPEKDFLFGDKYQMSSILSFYGPEQKRAYFLNLHQIRKNQFSYWPSMADEEKGKTGFFVIAENSPHLEKDSEEKVKSYLNLLQNYFSEVEYLGVKSLFEIDKKVVKGALIFKGVNYNGKLPSNPELY